MCLSQQYLHALALFRFGLPPLRGGPNFTIALEAVSFSGHSINTIYMAPETENVTWHRFFGE